MSTSRPWDSQEDDSSKKLPRIILVEETGIQVERDFAGMLLFNCTRNDVGKELHTVDPAEAAAALMRSTYLQCNKELWSLAIADRDIDLVQARNVLYWLTGGDREWMFGTNYKVKWDRAGDMFEDALADRVLYAVHSCTTLGELRDSLQQNFKLLETYELMLENNWVQPRR